MNVEALAIPDVKCIVPRVISDGRGLFAETYSQRALEAAGLHVAFVQDNHSVSRAKGVVRGLHFQKPPHAQGKLIRVTRGAVFDVALDIRQGSPTYGRHVSTVLSAENWSQLWVPQGFAYGSAHSSPRRRCSTRLPTTRDDPALGIDWPVSAGEATLSDKDRRLPKLSDLGPVFQFAGP